MKHTPNINTNSLEEVFYGKVRKGMISSMYPLPEPNDPEGSAPNLCFEISLYQYSTTSLPER